MDLYRIIDYLAAERNRLSQVIQLLERRASEGAFRSRWTSGHLDGRKEKPPARRRGRKSMDAAARREVSERMLRYWAQRRNGPVNASEKTSTTAGGAVN